MNDILGVDIEKITGCPNCGNTVDDMTNFCSNCGYSLNSPQQNIDGKESRRLFARKWVLTLVACLVLLVSAIVVVIAFNKIKDQNYNDEINKAVTTISSVSMELESEGYKTIDVWRSLIYGNYNDEITSEIFSKILDRRLSDEEYLNLMDSLIDTYDNVELHIEKLKNPPQKYEEAYEKFKELYSACRDYEKSVLNISEKSYNTYAEKFLNEKKEFNETISELRTILLFAE